MGDFGKNIYIYTKINEKQTMKLNYLILIVFKKTIENYNKDKCLKIK